MLFSMFLPMAVVVKADNPATKLHVVATGLKSDRGDVILALYNSPQTFTDHPDKTVYLNISGNKAEWQAQNLPPGYYAIALVHDENGNHHMDRNFLGIPKEPFAFSNNVKVHLHAPDYDEVKFMVGEGETQMHISLE